MFRSGVVVVLCLALSGLFVGVQMHEAEARQRSTTWNWNAAPEGPECRLSLTMSDHPREGYVRLTGIFRGCTGPRSAGAGDGAITMWGNRGALKASHQVREENHAHKPCFDPCSVKTRVRYTGSGEYCALAYYADVLYVTEHGHDPQVRLCHVVRPESQPDPPSDDPTPPGDDDPPGQEPPSPTPTELRYLGPTTRDYHDPFTASARLTGDGPAPGQEVRITLGSGGGPQTCVGTTDASGVARCRLTPTDRPGPTTVRARFAGTRTLTPSEATADFTVTRQETALSVDGPDRLANGTAVSLSGRLAEERLSGAPVADRRVTLALGRGPDRQSCAATTDPAGAVRCSVASVDQPLGAAATVPVTARFGGDGYFRGARASDTALLEYYTGRAYGLAGSVDLPVASVDVPASPDTGHVRTARATETSQPCASEVSVRLLDVSSLCPGVTTATATGTTTSTATVGEVRLGVPGTGLVELHGVRAESTSTCGSGGSASGRTDVSVRLAGVPVPVSGEPNAVVELPGGTRLVVNEQKAVPGADHGLTVNAVHLTTEDGEVDVVVGSATSGVHNCAR